MGHFTTPSNSRRLDYPDTCRGDALDDYHGTKVADPYRWLEDPNKRETRAWIKAQNDLTFGWLASITGREKLRERIEALWNYERFSLPIVAGSRFFYGKNDGLQNQSVLYVTEAIDEAGRVLLDPASFSEDGTVALAGVQPSPDGALLAYSVSEGGSDWRTWHILDVESGELLDDVLTRNKFGFVSWTENNAGLVYSRYAAPTKGDELHERNTPPEICLHTLGTPEEDDVVLEEPAPEGFMRWAELTNDQRAVVLTTVDSSTRHSEVSLLMLADDEHSSSFQVTSSFDARYEFIGDDGHDRLWLRTNLDAPNWRVIEVSLARCAGEDEGLGDREHWIELIPEQEMVMTGARVFGGRLVIEYLRDAHSEVRIYRNDGSLQQALELPGLGTVCGFTGQPDKRLCFFGYSDFVTPMETWTLDVETGETALFRRPAVDFDSANYESRQVFYESKDGTPIPMFIVHRKGLVLDGQNPTYLYGYGGFGISKTPTFQVPDLVWMENGGIFALASLRGGGEYGVSWHQAGTKLNKQNVFDDFIAAAEWLIEESYTSPNKLAIAGKSNGGLLVGACMVQRPELFGAALPAVGVLDMLRFQLFTIGWASVSFKKVAA